VCAAAGRPDGLALRGDVGRGRIGWTAVRPNGWTCTAIAAATRGRRTRAVDACAGRVAANAVDPNTPIATTTRTSRFI
jgi:hypothetical protein